MKHKSILNRICIPALVLVMILSTASAALAATNTTDSWVKKASMATERIEFQTEVVNGKIYAMGGHNSKGTQLSSVEEYDPTSNTWTTKASMSVPRVGLQTAVVNGKIYAMGGNSGNTAVSSVEEYDPVSNTWTIKASMFSKRSFFQSEVVNGKIYVIGSGIYSTDSLSSVEEYDPTSNTWTKKSQIHTPRSEFQTEVIGGKIYAIGGATSTNTVLNSVEEYNPTSNTWTVKTSMFTARAYFQAKVIGGKIYAIGGYNGSNCNNTVESYDPVSNSWMKNASMSTPRMELQTCAVNKTIYAIGGLSPNTSSVEKYDATTDTWTTISAMSAPRARFPAVLINGNIYVIGGQGKAAPLSSVEEYTIASAEPTLTVTASPNKVKVGEQFTTVVAIHNVTNICAEDVKSTYDTDLFEYVGAEAQTGLKICKEDSSTPGTIRLIVASLGIDNAATGDKGLINLKLIAKKQGQGKIDIVEGRIADNATLEMDVAEANCGETIITVEAVKDVNRSGEFTLIDLGIDAGYYGMNAADTDSSKYDADVVTDGKIDGLDLTTTTQNILFNNNYQKESIIPEQ